MKNRPNREIKDEEQIQQILKEGKFAIISMCKNNEPYIVTLSYGYDADADAHALYFHCASKGLKISFMEENNRVCATIIEDGGYVSNECAHKFKSVVFWGELYSVTDLEDKRKGMDVLLTHLEKNADTIQKKKHISEKTYPEMNILRLDIDEIHAKEGQ